MPSQPAVTFNYDALFVASLRRERNRRFAVWVAAVLGLAGLNVVLGLLNPQARIYMVIQPLANGAIMARLMGYLAGQPFWFSLPSRRRSRLLGSVLLWFAGRLCCPKTVGRVFEPAVADMEADCAAAGSGWQLVLALVRGCYALVRTAVTQAVWTTVDALAALVSRKEP